MPSDESLLSGKKGESVFAEPFVDYHWSVNELPSLMQRVYSAGDDRSFIVFSFIVIEKYLDALLEAIAPGYQALKDNRNFTASLKTEMLRALRLVPDRILQAMNMVRKIRNEFAHGDWEQLEQLPAKFKVPAANLVRLIFGDQPTFVASAREIFKALIFYVLSGLQAYRPNFLILREKLEDGILAEELKRECHKRFMEGIALRTKHEPLRVEEKDGWKYSYYEDGILAISASDPDNPPKSPALIPNKGVSPVLLD
jgi:hypothetical protein